MDTLENLSKIKPTKIKNTGPISLSHLLPKKEEECGPGKRCKKIGDKKRRCDTRTPQNPQGTNMCYELKNILVQNNNKSIVLEVKERKKDYKVEILNQKLS